MNEISSKHKDPKSPANKYFFHSQILQPARVVLQTGSLSQILPQVCQRPTAKGQIGGSSGTKAAFDKMLLHTQGDNYSCEVMVHAPAANENIVMII